MARRIPFTNDQLKMIWDTMFYEDLITSTFAECQEDDEHCLKISMLLKTAYFLHKHHFYKMKSKMEAAHAEMAEKDDIILKLRDEIARLKSAEGHEAAAVSSENESEKKSPTILKRLSGETQYLQNAFESAVKKIKVDVETVTPTKSDPVEILVPETVEYDLDDSTTVFNQGIFIPETMDMSMDGFPEPQHLELNERCSTPNKQNVSSPNPKSPVILTARAKKHSSLQVSSACLDLSLTKSSPDKSLKCESKVSKSVKQLQSPSPKKLQPKVSEPVSPLMSCFKQPQCDMNKKSPSKTSSVLKGQQSSASSVKRNFGKENKTDMGCKPSTSKVKQQQQQQVAPTVKGKNSKSSAGLEVRPTPKNNVAPKLKQTKLSLSMFKAKKTNVPQIDENQQLQMAIEESVKTAKQHDLEKMVISPSPDRLQSKKSVDSDKTYFEGATALSFDNSNVDTTPQRQSFDLDKTYFEDAKSLQYDSENKSPLQQTHDPDRTYFEDMKPPTQHADTSKVPQLCDPNKTYFEEAKSILYGLGNSPKKPDIEQPLKLEPTDVPSSYNFGHTVDKNYVQNYDRVPEKPKEDKGYVYQAGPIRKKDDRQKLPGWECHECKVFFETYCKNMNTQERQQIVGHCSKHRQALPFISNTPPGIWEIAELQSPVGVTQDGKLYHEPKKSKSWLIDNAVPMPPSLEPNLL